MELPGRNPYVLQSVLPIDLDGPGRNGQSKRSGPRAQRACQVRESINFEIIQPMPSAQALWYCAFFELQGNDKDYAFGLLIRYVERKLDFLLDETPFRSRYGGETNEDDIRLPNSLPDCLLPLLAGQQILLI